MIDVVILNEDSLFEASRAWKKYSQRKKNANAIDCPSCGRNQTLACDTCQKIISLRQHIVSDFLIGAYAKIQANRLITRERGFYRTYFSALNIFTP